MSNREHIPNGRRRVNVSRTRPAATRHPVHNSNAAGARLGTAGALQTNFKEVPRRQRTRLLIAAVAAILIIIGLVQFACNGSAQDSNGSTAGQQQAYQQQNDESSTEADQPASTVSLTVTALGDCTLGTDPNFDESTNFISKYNDKGPEYFFANVLPYTGTDDLTIGNCEGTFTTSTDIQEKTFNFKAPGEYAQILADGSVEAANLANNHSFDYGQQGFDDTKANLDAAGIVNFGYDRTATYEANGIKVGLFGVSQLRGTETAASQTQSDIQALKDEGCQLIIGVFHWGIEGDSTPSSEQVQLAHAAIDDGCDLVIGGHPHVLQGVEHYNGRYICYSMGNFCFGGNKNPKDKDTMMFQQTFTFENGQLQADDSTRNQASIVPCSISSSSSSNNYQPTPLTGDEGQRVVEKVNERSSKLSGTSVAFATDLSEDGHASVTW